MPDDQGRHLGNDQLLYVATTAPTDGSDETDPAYELVGLLVSNNFNGEGDIIRAADKAVSGFTSGLIGTRSYSLDVEAHRKNVADTGQAIVRDAWLNGTTTIYWLVTTGVDFDTCVYGTAAVGSYGENNPTNDYATMTATLEGQGAPTYDTVPT